ncbi:MAG: hypothetical protein DRQ57_08680 [Gammaproteobacteria bacterium]|nr:MAG: hypothetical protein DRQ57_08680 [Gammaproteobacteria bacterium]
MSLKKLTPLCLLILTLPISVFSQEIDLQGTKIIGDKKSATVTQESAPSPDEPAENAQVLLPAVIAPPLPEQIAEGVYRSEHFIDDKDVPPGYYKKRTPFGDFLIKDEEMSK